MIGKKLIGINSLGRGFADLKALFLIARHKIKQVQISNIGNIQTNLIPLKGFFWKGLLAKLIHDYSHKFTVLLSNLGIVSLNMGQYGKALNYLNDSKRIYEDYSDRAGLSFMSHNLGETYFYKGNSS